MNNLKYKEREETNMIRVLFEPKEKTVREIYTEQRKYGLFNIGYHLIILPNGEVKEGIPFLAYGDYRLAHTKDSVYVLLIGCNDKDAMSHAQRKAMRDIQNKYSLLIHFGDD